VNPNCFHFFLSDLLEQPERTLLGQFIRAFGKEISREWRPTTARSKVEGPSIVVLVALILLLAVSAPVRGFSGFTPTAIRGAYDVTPLLQSGYTGKAVTVAVVNSGIDALFFDDVNGFNAEYGLPATAISVVRPFGTTGTYQELPDGETTGDVEFVHAMAPDAKILLVLVGAHSLLSGFSYVIDNNVADIAVLSSSWAYWGSGASETVQSYNDEYAKSVGLKITLIAASNDWGSNNTVPWGTVVGDFWTQHLPDSYLMPQYSPYVTAVGGTILTAGSDGTRGGEAGWERSGGGPSNLFSEPFWQVGNGVPRNGHRNIPDLALNAACESAYSFYSKGKLDTFCGTSGAAPTFAGIMADIVQAAGSRIGFLNPMLYSIAAADPTVFYDVLSGCSFTKVGTTNTVRYCPTQGWDFVTGWGSPDSSKLAQHLAPKAQIVPEFPNITGTLVGAFAILAAILVLRVCSRKAHVSDQRSRRSRI
jgi:subtilase family serine protease